LGQLQDFDKTLGEEGLILAAEGAEGVVVGMGIGGEQAHRHAVVSALLDAAAAEGAGGVTVEEQAQEHVRRILFAAGAAGVDLDLAQVRGVHGIANEVDQVIGGHPLAQMGREEQRGVTVNGNETGGHAFQTRTPSNCSIHFAQIAFPKSGRLLVAARCDGKESLPVQAPTPKNTLSDFPGGGCLMGEMHDQSDAQLLRAYAQRGTEAAFAEIVARHTDLVHSAALRQVNSPELARDVTQSVFTDLARKAGALSGSLPPEASLVGWLYRGTRFAARDLNRGEIRRTQRERQAMEQIHPAPDSAPDWEQLRPALDDAMAELDEPDRDALLLRYFKNHDLRTVGTTLGISDDAAQKRVSRAVERLRELFAKRGVTVGGSGLAVVISAHAVQAAPAGLALTISTTAALTGTTLATTATATATKAIAMTALQKTVITATLAALAGFGIYEARQALQLRQRNEALQQTVTSLTEQIATANQQAKNQESVTSASQTPNPDFSEMLRLRGEVARQRREVEEISAAAKDAMSFQARVLDVFSNTPPVRTFVATTIAKVSWNQTVITGGWRTPDGKRAFVLATVQRGDTDEQVRVSSKVVEFTESTAKDLRLSGFYDEDRQTPEGFIMLDPKQTADLLQRTQDPERGSLASALTVTTVNGRQAQVQTTEMRQIPSGEKYSTGPILDFYPTVAADGQSVLLLMTAQLNYRIPIPSP